MKPTGLTRPEPAAIRAAAGGLPEVEVRDGRGRFQFWCTRGQAEEAVSTGHAYLERSGTVLRIPGDSTEPRLSSGDGTRRVLGTRHQALGWHRHKEHVGERR